MRTSLFYAITTDPDLARRFMTDLGTALNSSPDLLEACLSALPELAEAMTSRQRREIAERVGAEKEKGIVEVVAILQSLAFMMRQLADEDFSKDDVTTMLLDLEECAKTYGVRITDESKAAFRNIVEEIRNQIMPQYKELKNRKSTTAGVLPSLKSFGTTVELRAIVGREFRIGMSADEYEPDIKGLVPVVSVDIEVASGAQKEFSFQASPQEIAALIEELKSALVCLRQIEQARDEIESRFRAEPGTGQEHAR